MSPTIRISDHVYEHLQEHAEPFVDTPDSVLRRLLGIHGRAQDDSSAGQEPHVAEAAQVARGGRDAPLAAAAAANGGETASGPAPARSGPSRSRRRSANKRTTDPTRPPRAPRGSLMKDAEYELPILGVLAQHGGRAAKNEVLDELEPLLAEKLTELDRTRLASGEIRWRNRAQFARLRLVQRGEMEKNSPRGIWELAEAGRTRLEGTSYRVAQPGAR